MSDTLNYIYTLDQSIKSSIKAAILFSCVFKASDHGKYVFVELFSYWYIIFKVIHFAPSWI